jgi:hypothetical protein
MHFPKVGLAFLSLVLLMAASAAENTLPVKRVWARQYAGRGSGTGTHVGLDDDGSAIVLSVIGEERLVLTKYSSLNGARVWQIPVSESFRIGGLAVDASGAASVFLTQGTQTDTLHFSPDGALKWRQHAAAIAQAIAADRDGNVIVTGDLNQQNNGVTYKYSRETGTLIRQLFHPDVSFRTIAVDDSNNVILGGRGIGIHIRKCAAEDGHAIWERDLGRNFARDFDNVADLAVDPFGNVAVAGYFGYYRGGDNAAPYRVEPSLYYLSYTARYRSTDGEPIWERVGNGYHTDKYPTSVATDGSGNVIRSTFAFDGIFRVSKFDAKSGDILWEVKQKEGSFGGAVAVETDSSGNVITTGPGSRDFYTAKYSSEGGDLLWEARYSGPYRGFGRGAAALAVGDGFVVVTGAANGDAATVKYADAPTVRVLESERLDATTVRIRGEVNPNGLPSAVRIIYGTDSQLANATSTSLQGVGNGKEIVTVEFVLSQLQPGTTYYYRIIGSTEQLNSYGGIHSFSTAPTGGG